MARTSQGWKLRWPTGSKCASVRYWDPQRKRQVELGTGESEPRRAAARAAQIYAEAIRAGRQPARRQPCVEPPLSTAQAAEKWLAEKSSTADAGTISSYALYFETHLCPVFPSLLDVTTATAQAYIADRLKVVQAKTVRKELSALRGLLEWCVTNKVLSEAPVVPRVGKKSTGKAYAVRRRSAAIDLTLDEVRKLIALLPVTTARLGYVRPRFILGYEMGLRPSALDRLEVPKHWRPGDTYLHLSADMMKAREPSEKLLTKKALLALKTAAPKEGYIFGHHDYREVILKAASKALPPHKLDKFTAAHLRSAAITHFLEAGASLPAAQKFADHKYSTTTDKYVKASQKSVEDELRRQRRV